MPRRRRLPEDWEQIARRRVGWWPQLSADERSRLGELAGELVTTKRWEAARGFVVTDEVIVTIAVQACVMILCLDIDYFGKVGSILVHPSVFKIPGPRPTSISGMLADGSPPLHGEAHHDRGPVLIAWDQARFQARHRGRGRNVVMHEFAHKIDMIDGVVDGTPPLPNREALDRWVKVCSAELEQLRSGLEESLLDDYAATDPGEFFAVATEVFFDQPVELRAEKPELYAVFAEFYRQDPAAREPPEPHSII
jgi:Mlc titration factor MtfA (ptsG expression regulator)